MDPGPSGVPTDWLETRTSLLRRLKDRDDGLTWEAFVDSYGRVIEGYARRGGLAAPDVEDVVQETLAAVARHIGGFDYDPARGSFKSWLLTIARSRIIDVCRRRARDHRMLLVPSPDPAGGTTFLERLQDDHTPAPDQAFEEEWNRGLYEAARERVRARVSPRQYQIFDLHVIREWPVERVAGTLNITPNQVYLAKHRVGEAIAREIDRLQWGRI